MQKHDEMTKKETRFLTAVITRPLANIQKNDDQLPDQTDRASQLSL